MTPKRQLSEFGRAFAEARKSGAKEFTFKGKKFHTRTAEEEAKQRPEAQYVGDKKPVFGEQGSRRPEYKIEDVKRPGTEVTYENLDATMETFAKGGKVGSASSRADGIAMRGKTRGKVY